MAILLRCLPRRVRQRFSGRIASRVLRVLSSTTASNSLAVRWGRCPHLGRLAPSGLASNVTRCISYADDNRVFTLQRGVHQRLGKLASEVLSDLVSNMVLEFGSPEGRAPADRDASFESARSTFECSIALAALRQVPHQRIGMLASPALSVYVATEAPHCCNSQLRLRQRMGDAA